MLYFTLTASNTPEELVKAATLLLSTIKEQPKLTNAFHMEVEISNENVLFRVCIDSYITEIRNKIPPEMDGPSVVNLNCKDLEKRKAYTPCNRTSFHAKNLCAINFGKWESAISQDKYAQTCHAHVHLLFKKEAWEMIKKKNYMDLEKEHLQLEEGRYMLSSIDNLIDSVNELTKMTKDGFDSLTKAINNLANQIKEDKSKQ
ncbi:hypothetical protein RhiirA1_448827 [Rhizophagus irregularis]|uniref:Uncharacterized protein n=1 Tax=Rhizophagus irregularis TaxID=588596 RepID=A0A2I1FKS3_9GLOM|nr:hypothetical protein RhiirA1_448827 [Rhizophagus irregularis]PKY34961.1 hypothetical protein RhiirB3_455193 [Rhizophagus irregularis]